MRTALAAAALALCLGAPAPAAARDRLLSEQPGGHGDAGVTEVAGPARTKLVVWQEDERGDTVAFGRLVRRDGRPIGPVRRMARGAGGVRVAYNPRRREYLLAWVGTWPGAAREPCPPGPGYVPPPGCAHVDREVLVLRADRRGRPIGSPRRVTATGPADDADTGATTAALAVDPERGTFLVGYSARLADDDVGLRLQRLDGRARPLGNDAALPTPRAVAATVDLAWHPRRKGFLAVYAVHERIREGDLYARVLTRTAEPAAPAARVGGGGEERADHPMAMPARVGRGHLAGWVAGSGSYPGGRVTLRALDEEGQPAGPAHAVSPWAIRPEADAAPHGSAGYLVAWTQETRADTEVYTRRIGAGGAPIAPERRRTRTGPDYHPDAINPRTYHAGWPALAPVRGGLLLAWTAIDQRDRRWDAYARRL